MNIIFYDLGLLALFAIFISVFLYRGKKNLKKEGFLLLYKTSWGIKLINYVGKKYEKTLKVLSYVSIMIGYGLMALAFYFVYSIVKIYLFRPEISNAVKVPPIMPLIPYLPQLFNLDFMPPFYFVYWILILAIIAISHEFSHGIFAAYNKIKIKNTGFGFFPFFLPVFLAAFVELDEKRMAKKSKFAQLTILSAGTFANILTAILFFFILWGFFSLAFQPAGIAFDTYPYEIANFSILGNVTVNNIPLKSASYENILINMQDSSILNEIKINGKTYLTTKENFENQKKNIDNYGMAILFTDGPAIRVGLNGPISRINGVEIKNINTLAYELEKYSPGDIVTLEVIENNTEKYNLDVVLGKDPEDPQKAYLGIGFYSRDTGKLSSKMYLWVVSFFKEEHVYYIPKFEVFSTFIYNLLWWILLISISVAIVNMLPVGIFDGGRFFYLSVLGITKSEKFAKQAFAFLTYLFLFIILGLMLMWGWNFFR